MEVGSNLDLDQLDVRRGLQTTGTFVLVGVRERWQHQPSIVETLG